MCVCVCVCVCVCGGIATVNYTCLVRQAWGSSICSTGIQQSYSTTSGGRGTDLETETGHLMLRLVSCFVTEITNPFIEERLIWTSGRSFPMGILLSGLFLKCLNIVDLKPIQKLFLRVCWRTDRMFLLVFPWGKLKVFTVCQLRADRHLPSAT